MTLVASSADEQVLPGTGALYILKPYHHHHHHHHYYHHHYKRLEISIMCHHSFHKIEEYASCLAPEVLLSTLKVRQIAQTGHRKKLKMYTDLFKSPLYVHVNYFVVKCKGEELLRRIHDVMNFSRQTN